MARRLSDSPVLQTLAVCAIAGGHSKSARGGTGARAQAPIPQDQEHALDFWVGEWHAFTDEGRRLGSRSVKRVLGGCAVLENWRSVAGDEAKSLYVFKRTTGEWTRIGGAELGEWNEQVLIETERGRVRFQGAHGVAGRAPLLARTTLTQLDDTRVRQAVEQSRDGGKTWQFSFQATHVRRTDG